MQNPWKQSILAGWQFHAGSAGDRLWPSREFGRHSMPSETAHGTQVTEEECRYWVKRKDIKSYPVVSSFVGHVPPSPPVPGEQGWELPWASSHGGAGVRGPADPAWEAWTPKRWGGPHSCRKLCCCLPAMQNGDVVVLLQGQWTRCNSLGSAEGPLTDGFPGHMFWFSSWLCSDNFESCDKISWLLSLMCPRNSDFVYNPHPCSRSTQAQLFKGSLSQRNGMF